MSDLVGNPEDRFSQNEAQIKEDDLTTQLSIIQSNLLPKAPDADRARFINDRPSHVSMEDCVHRFKPNTVPILS